MQVLRKGLRLNQLVIGLRIYERAISAFPMLVTVALQICDVGNLFGNVFVDVS